MVVQVSVIVLCTVLPLVVLSFVARAVMGELTPFRLLPVYLGLPGDVSPGVASAALERVPRGYLLPMYAMLLYTLFMLPLTYMRWKPVFYLLLVGAGVKLAASIAGIVFGGWYGLVCGGTGILLSLANLFIVSQLEVDFFLDEKRILLRVDRRAGRGLDLLARGRQYARRQMWALAALYLRQALAQIPLEYRMEGYRELAIAYTRLKRTDLAERVLADATQFHPHDPRIAELASLTSFAALLDGQNGERSGESGSR
jgi:hypothetical protein